MTLDVSDFISLHRNPNTNGVDAVGITIRGRLPGNDRDGAMLQQIDQMTSLSEISRLNDVAAIAQERAAMAEYVNTNEITFGATLCPNLRSVYALEYAKFVSIQRTGILSFDTFNPMLINSLRTLNIVLHNDDSHMSSNSSLTIEELMFNPNQFDRFDFKGADTVLNARCSNDTQAPGLTINFEGCCFPWKSVSNLHVIFNIDPSKAIIELYGTPILYGTSDISQQRAQLNSKRECLKSYMRDKYVIREYATSGDNSRWYLSDTAKEEALDRYYKKMQVMTIIASVYNDYTKCHINGRQSVMKVLQESHKIELEDLAASILFE